MPELSITPDGSPAPIDAGEEALQLWIDTYRGPLIGLIASWRPDWQEATETAQDVFAEAWAGRGRFRGDVQDLQAVGAWLRGIAFRLAASRARARQRRPQAWADLDGLSPLDKGQGPGGLGPDGPEDERLDAMRTAFAGLSDEHQTVLRMHYLERTTARDVATLLSLTPKAVEQRLYRARRALQEKAQRELDQQKEREGQ